MSITSTSVFKVLNLWLLWS